MSESTTIEKNAAAFFDLDGTVVTPPSLEWRFVAHLARKRNLRAGAVLRWLRVFLSEALKHVASESSMPMRLATLDRNKAHLAGLKDSSAAEWANEILDGADFYPQALDQIARHRERGHAIFFVSGTLGPIAQALASRLAPTFGEIHVAATALENIGGRWTGRVFGDAICGPAKAKAMSRLADLHKVDLRRSYAYANSSTDFWMLAAVGHPVAVNPAITLAQLARQYGWPIVRWNTDHAICLSAESSCAATKFPANAKLELTRDPLTSRRNVHGRNSI